MANISLYTKKMLGVLDYCNVRCKLWYAKCSCFAHWKCRSPFILLWGNLIQTEPSIGASHQSSAHSPLNLLSQMNRNLVGSNYGRSSIKIAHFIPIRWQTWSPQTIIVSDWPISNNLLLWNKNCLWIPCLSTDRDEMSNLYRRPSIVASYQGLVHLAKKF
jgi:hypothetical protein